MKHWQFKWVWRGLSDEEGIVECGEWEPIAYVNSYLLLRRQIEVPPVKESVSQKKSYPEYPGDGGIKHFRSEYKYGYDEPCVRHFQD